MHPSIRRRQILLIPVAALIAISPLLRNGVSCGHDLDFHLQSWLEVAHQFAHGSLHPHWAFTPAYNAGEPRFVFYPPLSWTIGALLTLALTHLPGLSPATAFAAAPILYTGIALTAAGLAMHMLARRYTPAPIALLVATLYLVNPYTFFTAYERTAFAELLAAAWIPLLLLALLPPGCSSKPERTDSLSSQPGRTQGLSSRPDPEQAKRVEGVVEEPMTPPSRPKRSAVEGPDLPTHPRLPSTPLVALAIALLWLTNAPAAVMGCYTVALLAAIHLLALYRQHRSLRPLIRPTLQYTSATLLGLALAAFYIVPAAYERRWAEINLATVPGMRIADNTLFHHTPDPDHDAVLHTASIIAISLLTVTTAALFLATPIQRRRSIRNSPARPQRPQELSSPPKRGAVEGPASPLRHKIPAHADLLTILATLTATIAALLTPVAAPIWRHAPELAFLQFPWRLLAILAPICALSIALALRSLRLSTSITLTLSLVLPSILTVTAYPAFRQSCDTPDTPQAQLTAFTTGAGSDPTDEYTPETADNDALKHSNPAWTLVPSPPNPAQPSGPAPTHLNLDLTSPETLVLNLRDYPAWQVTRNGTPIASRVERPDGLLALLLPAGHSTINLIYRTTPDQIAGDAISLAALCVFVPLTLVSLRRRMPRVS